MKLPDGYADIKNQDDKVWYNTLIRIAEPRSLCNISPTLTAEKRLKIGDILALEKDAVAVAAFLCNHAQLDNDIVVDRSISPLLNLFMGTSTHAIGQHLDQLFFRFSCSLPSTRNRLNLNGVPSITRFLANNPLEDNAVLLIAKAPK